MRLLANDHDWHIADLAAYMAAFRIMGSEVEDHSRNGLTTMASIPLIAPRTCMIW